MGECTPPNHQSRQQVLYTFFDVETPNRKNDCICSIGLATTDASGKLLYSDHYLVNPEDDFDVFNTKLHKISKGDVKDAPTFEQLWNQGLSNVFSNHVVVAHNAKFDTNVLDKTLKRYGIYYQYDPYVLCTLEMARQFGIECENYKLPTIAEYIGYDMGTHHNALCDTYACMNVFWYIVRRFNRIPEPTRFSSKANKPKNHLKTSEFGDFLEMVKEVIQDGIVDTEEGVMIANWLFSHPNTASNKAIKPIFQILQMALVDGCINQQESKMLMRFLDYVTHPLLYSQPVLDFDNKNFVLTGDFAHGDKTEIEKYIIDNGGIIKERPSGKTDYVVVGAKGSEAYKHGDYGSKVRKALELQADGSNIQITKESDLFANEVL